MARREKRELQLQIDADSNADKAFDDLADSVDSSTKKLEKANVGLKKIDRQIADTTKTIGELREEVRRTGDVELFKDIDKQTAKLRQLTKRQKFLGPQDGEESAEGFFAGFRARLGPLVAGAPVSGPIIAAAAGAAPAIASVIAGGVTLGIASGAVGAGIMIAAKDPQVAGAAKAVGAQIGDALGEDIGAAFRPEVRAALSYAQTEFRSLRPDLRALGRDASQLVKPFTVGVVGGAKILVGSLRQAVADSEPLAELMGEHIPAMATVLGGVIEDLASASESSADTLDSVLTFMEGSLAVTGEILKGLALFQQVFGGMGQVFGDIMGDGESEETSKWADGLGDLAGKIEEAGGAARKTKGEVRGLAEQIAAMDEVMRNVHDANISAAQSNIQYRDSLNQAKEAADSKKKVSQEEESALLDLASATNTNTAAMQRAGASTAELTERSVSARKSFVDAAMAMGFSETKANELADAYLDVPGEIKTKANLNKQQAERDLGSLNRSIDNATRARTVVVKFKQIGGLGAIGQIGMSEGGAVEGPGPRGIDSLVRVLAPGEHVISEPEVRAAGGHREIERVRKALRGGRGTGDAKMRSPNRGVSGYDGSGGGGYAGSPNPVGIFGPGVARSWATFMTNMTIAAGGDPDVFRFGRGRAGVR